MRFFLFLLLTTSVSAQITDIIPAYRLTEWGISDYVGVRGGPLTNRVVYTNYNPTTGTEISSDLQGVINNCPSNEVVVVGPGDFFVDASIFLKAGTTLRGSGMFDTWFNFRVGGFVEENDNSTFNRHTGQRFTLPITAGTTNITVANGSAFTLNCLAMLARYNSSSESETNLVIARSGQSTTNSPNGFTYATTRRVVNIAGNVVTIWPPLEKDWTNDAVLFPMNNTTRYLGLEDFTMTCSNVVLGINWTGVQDSWMKRVKTMETKNHTFYIAECVGIEVSECWFDDGKPSGSNGSHVQPNTSSGVLVENNIMMNSFPCIEVNAGTYRSVFAYNYCFNTNGLAEIYSNHGVHNTFNLYEGNIANHILSDGYFGGESEPTVFRNWIMAIFPATAELVYTIGFKRFSRNVNVVGNIFGLGSPWTTTFDGYSWGGVGSGTGSEPPAPPWASFPTGGADPEGVYLERDSGVTNTLVLKKNYNFHDDAIPSGEASSSTIPDSLYRTSKPWYFPNNYTYPPINSASVNTSFNPSNTWILPAQYAYFNGGVWPTDSGDTFVTNAPPRIRGFRFK